MNVTAPIRQTFADEHVIGTDPPMRSDQSGFWRRRINAFAGRALSDKAMTAEQDLRSGTLRLYGLALNPGIVEGLAAIPEFGAIGAGPADAALQVSPGLAIARSGEDVSIGRAVRAMLADLPVILRADHADALAADKSVVPDAPPQAAAMTDESASVIERLGQVRPRVLGPPLGTVAASDRSAALPHVAVLVAQPVTAEIVAGAADRCPPDPRDDAYVDLQRIDGARLALYIWPAEMIAVGGGADYALPPAGAARRNALAYAVFDNERLLGEDEAHPWEAWGAPLALLGFADDWTLQFVDRHAVARIGGTPKERSPVVPRAGDHRLWQARVDQFTAQLAELPSLDTDTLQSAFVRLPPIGVLPPEMLDVALQRQHFFPSGFSVDAAPVAMSDLNLVVGESASLAAIDRGQADAVELLVPVPDELFEPGLLDTEQQDPRFGEAIKALRSDRQDWLVRRQMARRRYDRLTETISGVVAGWPAADLPSEENSPAPHVQTPVEVTRTRRFGAGADLRTHAMTQADATLPVALSDTLWFWVNVHAADQLTGISLRLASGSRADTPTTFAKGVFWGAADGMPIAAEAGGLSARKQGDLPAAGIWTRLEVPASAVWDANGGTLDGVAVNAMEFTQRGGDVEWAAFGKTDAAGLSYTYLADDAPAGSVLTVDGTTGWSWTPVSGREALSVGDFGTTLTDDVRRAAALDQFRSDWQQDFLKADLDEVNESGIAAFLASVDARLKATNDAIDLGFVRARSDIYRVRQIMLGADAASRLVTSPSLSDLALRDEGARATSQGISQYLTAAALRTPLDTVIKIGPAATSVQAPAGAPPAGQAPAGGTPVIRPNIPIRNLFQSRLMTLNISQFTANPAPAPAAARVIPANFRRLPATFGGLANAMPEVVVAAPSATAAPQFNLPSTVFQPAIARPAFNLQSLVLATGADRFRMTDIQRQIPIAGLVERTVSVAERLTPQPAVQALEYALASKAAIVQTLAGLVGAGSDGRPKGIALDDIPMAGFARRTDATVPRLAELVPDLKAQQVFVDADKLPETKDQKHEAEYFTAAVQAIDNNIAIMRLVEGRVTLFQELAGALDDLKTSIEGSAGEAAAYLRSVDVEVAEARQDLATAERLRAEEQARIDAVNQRRAAILDTHVNAIVWRRRRSADVRDAVPLIEAPSALAPNPVAACRREHDDVPDEIHDYVQLLREVPVGWFPAIAAQVHAIERLESAQAAIRTMIERAASPRFLAAARQVTATNRLLIGVQHAMIFGRQVVEERQAAVRMIDMARAAQLSLTEAHAHLAGLATIGDLVSGTHRHPPLTRAASEELDAIASVAGCLHESFGEVAPIVRLGWAEALSEFDRPAPLANLAGLTGWAEVPVALRRTLQQFVDWLFSRIDQQSQPARDAINELIRVCLLMAAQSPVDRIIPAHLITPAPARLGGRLFLALDIAKVRKGMVTLIRDGADRIVSHAVIDDIVDGRAQATITHVATAITMITPAMRFQLVANIAR